MFKKIFSGDKSLLRLSSRIIKNFSLKVKKEEILLYVMQDKYSIKPDKEFRITHSIIEDEKGSLLEESADVITDESTLDKVTKGKILGKNGKTKPSKIVNYGKHSIKEISTLKLKLKNFTSNIRRNVFDKILPRDFPYSVKKGYAGFSNYTFISNVLFSVMNFVTTQVLINAMNLSISRATGFVLSAGMNWAIKEGLGQIGSILYITKYTEAIEKNAKSWRVISIQLATVAFLMESTSLVFTNHFLLVAAAANFVKLVSLNTTQISRITIIENYSKENNIVDLSNKFTIQNNISMLVGNLLGFSISFVIPLNNFTATFACLTVMSIYNIWTAYKCLEFIEFNYFNFQRASIFCEEFISSSYKTILSPEDVASKEKVFYGKHKCINFCNKSPDFILNVDQHLYIIGLFEIFREKNFFVLVKKKFNLFKMKNEYKIYTFLKVNAENNDVFLAFLFTIRLSTYFNQNGVGNLPYEEILDAIEDNLDKHEEIDKKALFDKMKNSGWKLNFGLLEEKYLRYHTVHKDL